MGVMNAWTQSVGSLSFWCIDSTWVKRFGFERLRQLAILIAVSTTDEGADVHPNHAF